MLLICVLHTEAQYGKEDNVVLIKSRGEADCGDSGTIGEKCRNGLICRTLNGGSECSGKKSLQIKKDLFCGQKDTLQRRCQRGGICIRTAKKSFKCKKGGPGRGGKKGSGGKRGKRPAKPEAPKEVHVPNQIDCDAMGVPPTCRVPTMLYFGGSGGNGASSYPRCNSEFWKQLPDSPGDVGLAIMKGEIYACGGGLENGAQYSADCYKNVGGNWVKSANLNTPRSKHTMTTIGNSMIVAGGRNNEGFRLLSSMEIFKGEKWETLEHKLPIPVKAHCAVAISDKEILFIAGDNTNGKHGGQTVGNQVQTYHL
ncbi:uncharacterized protein LOC111704592 isoform X2 [Eurytemora carolleeae]|uniref:uncharacterized protein LOC111704592 isoform X2 n=1 Tax=Eurytemora carolleeae TaxID=1294199 RepID=UPI000C75606D|nr:uncharacterized protein LOC111704592 isoform X2 [Eurytemora carolleeae]|eukprot:XP_023332644.1 uncharacterized protein LOC111704592 isoform X2 [Eurytemora affinis]